MTRTGKRILGGCSFAVCVLLAAGAVGASTVAPAVPHYVEPHRDSYVRVAALFGESDEEKAARLQHEADQDGQISRLNDKVRDLEDTLRNVTGQNEELEHRLGDLNEKLERQRKDFEYRLCMMAAQQLGTGAGQNDPNAVPCGSSSYAPSGGGSSYAPSGGETMNAPSSGNADMGAPRAISPQTANPDEQGANTPQGDGAPHLARGPGVLGTLPAGTDTHRPQPSAPTQDDTHAQFSTAMNLLAKARYDEASAAFRSFADAYPKDDLASQAIYWVGDIAYVQKDYGGAARAFAEVIKKYPTSVRAPDSMLKLGQALIAAGQKKEGCTALAALPAKYPKASKAILGQGADARKAVCRGTS